MRPSIEPQEPSDGLKRFVSRHPDSTVAIRVRDVSKAYPGIQALSGVNFELATEEVHGLVGANGAGKSTLIKMLSGASRPDTGSIEVYGSPVGFEDDPRRQRRLGIAAIYQELTIVPGMSALSNAFLGAVPQRFGVTDGREMRRRYSELADWMGVDIQPDASARTLSVAGQQTLEIMRAVLAEQCVFIMDEPTAPLGPKERTALYDLIGRLKSEGASIIFISHDLDEVLELCDRVSVMKEGRLIASKTASQWAKDTLVQTMLGQSTAAAPQRRQRRPETRQAALLKVTDLTLPGKVSGLTFELRPGEVLGIAGLVGSGRTEALRALAGAESDARGALLLDGKARELPWSVRSAVDHGLVLAPEDRKRDGLVLGRSSLANLMLADLGGVASGSVVSRSAAQGRGGQLARRLGFNPSQLATSAGVLSGGNQQKLVLGKWLNRSPRILLLDEPTRGIDLGAKQEIFDTIHGLVAQGMAVILVSSDLEEVVEHSDRILVMAKGRQLKILESEQASVEQILNLVFAVTDKAAEMESEQ